MSGLAVGQKASSTKFSKYEEPANISKMEWDLLQARVDSMKFWFPDSDGIGQPEYIFDRDKGMLTAYILVGKSVLNRQSVENVRKSLRDGAIDAQAFVYHYMPEVSDENFIVYYRVLEKSEFITLAEYKNGQLSLH